MNDNIYINASNLALGDTIAFIPTADILSKKNPNKKIFISNKFYYFFKDKYKHLYFLEHNNFWNENDNLFIEYESKIYNINEFYSLGYSSNYLKKHENVFFKKEMRNKRLQLQKQFAHFLNIDLKEEIKPKISLFENNFQKPFEKYVCIATQTTMQAKYWNYPNGWEIITDYLNKLNYKVICIDKYASFGNLVYMNYIPKNATDRTGDLDLQERITDIYNCEFFIGLPSGLSWLAWALNKKVILISGFSDPKTEFYTPYRIINEQVCNSCWNDENFIFPYKDFMFCPRHRNTERMFECTKLIHPDLVIEKINKLIKQL